MRTDTTFEHLAAMLFGARFLCADDSPEMANMLALLVGSAPDMVGVGTLRRAERIVEEVILPKAEIVVLDLTMPGPALLAAIGLKAQHVPSCRVIASSVTDDSKTRENVRRAGAQELVREGGECGDIVHAIRRAAAKKARTV